MRHQILVAACHTLGLTMRLYHGIKYAYPRLAGLAGEKARAIIQNSRPYTLMAPLIGGIGIMYGASEYTGNPLGVEILAAGVVLALLNAGGNQFNSIYDQEIDEVNKPYRPLVRGALSVDAVYAVGTICYVLAVALASIVGPWFTTFTFVLFLFSIFYSVPPIRAKKRLWFNNVWQALSRGLFGVVAAWSAVAPPTYVLPWAFGTVTAMWMMGAQTSKDFPDVEGDRKFGVRTLPVVYGKDKAQSYMAPFIVGAFGLLALYLLFGAVPGSFSGFFILSIPSLGLVATVNREIDILENSVSWACMYLTLTGWYLGFALLL